MHRRSLLQGLAAGLLIGPSAAAAEPCVSPGATPTMVTGPFPPLAFRSQAAGRPNPGAHLALSENDMDLATVEGASGTPIGQVLALEILVLTAGCKPVQGADVELWQADKRGNYNHKNERSSVGPSDLDPNFGYWGSGKTDAEGKIRLRTVLPGAYPAGRTWWRPPHLHWSIAAQGLGRVTTQSFFDGDVLDGIEAIRGYNRDDLILHYRGDFAGGLRANALSDARRRATEELKVHFELDDAGTPFGKLVLRLG
ncbi:MAG: hypothetical protein KC912_22000 [Proteobacteria bacterium]|nr:hypothetical protein [Pseudomonadota bacterium]